MVKQLEEGLTEVRVTGEGGRVLGEFTEGEGGAGGLIGGFAGGGELVRHVVHLIVEESVFHGPGATEAPLADGHFVDGEVLGVGGRCEVSYTFFV